MYLDLDKINSIDNTHVKVQKLLKIDKIAYKYLYNIGFRFEFELKRLISYIAFLDETITISLNRDSSSGYYNLSTNKFNISKLIHLANIQTYSNIEEILIELQDITNKIKDLEINHLKKYDYIKDILEKNNTTEILLNHTNFKKITIGSNDKNIFIDNRNILNFDRSKIVDELIILIEKYTVKNNINFEKFVNKIMEDDEN